MRKHKNEAEEFFHEHWNDLRHAIKERWPKITDNELDRADAQSDMLVGMLQEHYWISKAQAEEQLRKFLSEYRARHFAPALA